MMTWQVGDLSIKPISHIHWQTSVKLQIAVLAEFSFDSAHHRKLYGRTIPRSFFPSTMQITTN